MPTLSLRGHSPVRFIGLLVVASLTLSLAGCGDDGSVSPGGGFDAAPILQNCAHTVILQTYEDLRDRAAELRSAVITLRTQLDEAHLEAARTAWRAARQPWEASEGFLFGPVETQGIDPAIDSWPVNVTDLDAVLASSSVLTKEFVDGLEGTLKGFHTIEYLLWGDSGTLNATAITARQLEYLDAATGSLAGETARLALAWAPSGGGFADHLANAGESGSIYVSARSGLQELVTGMITIADEVGNGKINDPFAARDPLLEESRFSGNSLTDFADNIRSIANIYSGIYGSTGGAGVSDFVKSLDPELDTRVRGEIEEAIAGIEAVPGPFSSAIFEHREGVESAQNLVRRLQQTLEESVAPLLERL